MEYKEAINILLKLSDKRRLSAGEKEAVLTAIGVLEWVKIGKDRMKRILKAKKAKQEKDMEI